MENEWTEKIETLEAENAALKDKLGLCECDNEVLRLKESERNAALEAELEVALGKIRGLEWEIYRPLKEGEMTKPGDQVLLPDEDAVWTVITGQKYRIEQFLEAPSPLYPAHCLYRRHIANELRQELAEIKKDADRMQVKKGFAGKESARQKKIEALEAENAALKAELEETNEILAEQQYEDLKLLAERNDKIVRLEREFSAIKADRTNWEQTAGIEADGLESWKKAAEKYERRLAPIEAIYKKYKEIFMSAPRTPVTWDLWEAINRACADK